MILSQDQTNVVIACFWRAMGYAASTRFYRESGFVANVLFWVCFVQTFTQTQGILLRFCAQKIGGWDLWCNGIMIGNLPATL